MINNFIIVLMSCDRPTLLDETLLSISDCDLLDNLIISDNSTKYKLEINEISKKYGVTVVCRNGIDPLNHLQLCLSVNNAKYLMVFHDDDVLSTDFGKIVNDTILAYPNCAAYGFNANIMYENRKTDELFFSRKKNIFVESYQTFVHRYFRYRRSYTPFPFYVYNTEKIQDIVMSLNFDAFGKHSDVYFLATLAQSHSVLMTSNSVGYYRFHNSQDSASSDFLSQIGLIRSTYNHIPSLKALISFTFLLQQRIINRSKKIISRLYK